MKRLSTIIGLIITIVVLTWLFQTISFGDVFQLMLEADLHWVATFFLCSFVMSVGHTWRYLTLLSVSGYRVNSVLIYLVVLVRNLASDLLPARLGTLVYVYLITSRFGIPLRAATSSFAYALIFDFVAVAPLVLFAAILAFGVKGFNPLVFALIGGGLVVVFSVIVLLLPRLSSLGVRFLKRLSLRLKNRALERISVFAYEFDGEIQKTAHSRILGRVLALSFMIRIFKYAGLYSFLMALLIPRGYGWTEVSPAKILLAMFAAEFSSSLPISGIAGLGTYQGVWLAAFSILGFPEHLAATTSVSHHLFTQLYGYGLGLIALLILLLPWFTESRTQDSRPFHRSSGVVFALRLVAFLTVIFGVGFALHAQEEKKINVKPNDTLQELRDTFLKRHTIVFDSNRSGTFGIYILGEGATLKTLVDTPERHEMFPSPSPDGRLVAYASSKGSGRFAESEIWVVNRENGEKILLAKNATFPTFTADGSKIIFERDRKKVMQIPISGGNEQEIFPAKWADSFEKFQVVKPSLSQSGRKIAFTSDKGGRWFAYVADLQNGEVRKLAHGCQPTFQSERQILFVKNRDAWAEAGLYWYSLNESSETILLDSDDPAGKEYFPSATKNTVLFAKGEGKSHERDTYNLFALKDGNLIQLTSDTATNRWPKLLRDRR